MSNPITIIQDIEWRFAYQYDWDTKHLDTSEIVSIKKIKVSDNQLTVIRESTLDKVEKILQCLHDL